MRTCLFMFCIHYIDLPMPGLFDIRLHIVDRTLINGNENDLSAMSVCVPKDDASSLSCSKPSFVALVQWLSTHRCHSTFKKKFGS